MQELAEKDHSAFHGIFLDLKKAYDKLHCGRTMAILRGYRAGPHMCALLQTFWDNQQIVASQAGYYGSPFQAHGGVTQGGIVFPTISI
jgi:hypothetical protein